MRWHLDAIRPRLETGVQIQLEVTRTVPILCVYCAPGPGQALSRRFLSTVNHEWLVQQLLLHITVEKWLSHGRGEVARTREGAKRRGSQEARSGF